METAKPAWRRRFETPSESFPAWSTSAPRFVVFTSRQSGSLQAWSFDTQTNRARRLTDEPVGVEHVMAAGDGLGAIWWQDNTGSERGGWMCTPFRSDGPLDATPVFTDIALAWSEGIGTAPGVAVAAFSDEDGYRVFVARSGAEPKLIAESNTPLGIGREWFNHWNGLSADGNFVCLRVSEDGDITESGFRVVDTRSGEVAGELADPGRHLSFSAWSPVAGDQRIAFVHWLEDRERPGIWDLETGERRDFAMEMPGGIDIAGWWPDATAMLARHIHDGRARLVRIDVATGDAHRLHDFDGWIENAGVRPDGDVWFRAESSTQSPMIETLGGGDALPHGALRAPTAPSGTPYRSFHFDNPAGQRIHGFIAEPPTGEPPFPTILMAHGGPDWAYPDAFDPHVQAFVDHGYLVAMINYRGSTTYGAEFERAIKGNVGFPEVEDLMSGIDHLIAEGRANPDRLIIEGWSWGGYLSLLAPGLHPNRFVAAIGGIPVADYIACHEDASPVQQAWDVAINGGSPEDKPEYYRERSPITYVDRIRAPILIIAGENDSRCPIRQIRAFADALRERKGVAETHIFGTGHQSSEAAELADFVAVELSFLHRHVPGLPAPIE